MVSSFSRVLYVANPDIETGNQGASGLMLASAARLILLPVNILVEGGPLSPRSRVSVTLTGAAGLIPLRAVTDNDGVARLSVPAGDSYRIAVSNLPDGYSLKSIADGPDDLMNGGTLSVTVQSVLNIVVTLARN